MATRSPHSTLDRSTTQLQPPIYSSERYGWSHILVEEFHQPPGQEQFQSATKHTVFLSLNRRPNRILQVIGDRCHRGLLAQGDLSITPVQLPLFCQWDQDDQYLRIQIAADFLKQVAQEAVEIDPNQIELQSEFRVRNPQIEQISLMLLSELKNGGFAGRLYVESLTNVLAVQLIQNHSVQQACVVSYEGGLSNRQLLQVTDYINDHLAEEIKLSSLAALVNMSQFHFGRLFKQSMGSTPHQYVLQQRLERAKQLLKETDLSVMEIAMRCGFSSHSHLGKAFRQNIGVSPKIYRISG